MSQECVRIFLAGRYLVFFLGMISTEKIECYLWTITPLSVAQLQLSVLIDKWQKNLMKLSLNRYIGLSKISLPKCQEKSNCAEHKYIFRGCLFHKSNCTRFFSILQKPKSVGFNQVMPFSENWAAFSLLCGGNSGQDLSWNNLHRYSCLLCI